MQLQPIAFIILALTCGVKVIPGVLLCVACNVHWINQLLATFIGGTLGIVFFTYFSDTVGRFWRKYVIRKMHQKNENTKRTGKYKKVWDKYGLIGVAFLTPPLFSPPIGTVIALSFGTPKKKLLLYFIISMAIWCIAFTALGSTLIYVLEHFKVNMPDCSKINY